MNEPVISVNQNQMILLKVMLGLIMFGIALKLDIKEFKRLIKAPKPIMIGLLGQLVLLPALTLVLVHLLSLPAAIALGLFVVASCPGGNMSNLLTDMAGGDLEYSVSMTSLSSFFGPLTIPLNILFWSSLYAPTKSLVSSISLDTTAMYVDVFVTLGVPLLIGMILNAKLPSLMMKIAPVIGKISVLILVVFIIGAAKKYWAFFDSSYQLMMPLTMGHNFLAMLMGYLLAFSLTKKQQKTLTFEIGMQNSGIGLAIILQYFTNDPMTTIVCCWWAVIHMTNGLIVIGFWKILESIKIKKPLKLRGF